MIFAAQSVSLKERDSSQAYSLYSTAVTPLSSVSKQSTKNICLTTHQVFADYLQGHCLFLSCQQRQPLELPSLTQTG